MNINNKLDDSNLKLTNVWRTCNKIRSAITRIKLDLWQLFKPFDPNGNTLISESKFINVFTNRLKNVVGLSDEEILELTDYFRFQDGRICYHQFCNVIHSDEPNHEKNPNLVSGLEWEDPLQVNRLSLGENRRLCILLTKIAHSVRLREFVMKPFFQDYELVSKNVGTVTLPHFSRVLHFLKITLSTDDYYLLLKRFMKDSYTVNYVAFVEEIEKIMQYFDSRRMVDPSGDIIENFPGRIIDAQLPKLPRPSGIAKTEIADKFKRADVFHPALLPCRILTRGYSEILLRIKKHVLDYGIRTDQYFKDFDLHSTGLITKSQFLRGLDAVFLAGLHRLFLSDYELNAICNEFVDDQDPSLIKWKLFVDTVDGVFTKKHLDKNPLENVDSFPSELLDLRRDGNADWSKEKIQIRDICQEVVSKIRAQIKKRQLNFEASFKVMGNANTFHVTRSQMRRVISMNGIVLSDEEFNALDRRYSDDMGFNYIWFLNEANPKEFNIPLYNDFRNKMIVVNQEKPKREPHRSETDIVQVLANVKGQAVRKRIRIKGFLKDYDRHNELCIIEANFRRGLINSNIILSEQELDLICKVFKSPLRDGHVDYENFCQVIEESFVQTNLERNPLIIPLQHIPSDDNEHNFLNFDERQIVSKALQKLAKEPDQVSNISSIFQDYDKTGCGAISQSQFLRALTTRNLHCYLTTEEFELLCKCFGVEKGLHLEVDYRKFMQNLNVLFVNRINYPF